MAYYKLFGRGVINKLIGPSAEFGFLYNGLMYVPVYNLNTHIIIMYVTEGRANIQVVDSKSGADTGVAGRSGGACVPARSLKNNSPVQLLVPPRPSPRAVA